MKKIVTMFLALALFAFSAPPTYAETIPFNGEVGYITDTNATSSLWYLRQVGNPAPSGYSHAYQWGTPQITCNPNSLPVEFSGTINVSSMVIGDVSMIGLIDKGLLEINKTGYQSGAYIYIYKNSATTVRIGPSDGNLGGEIISKFKDYTIPGDGIFNISMTISANQISISVNTDTAIIDIYGVKKGTFTYDWEEFSSGAIPGWDNYPTTNRMPYNFNLTGCEIPNTPLTVPTNGLPNGTYKLTNEFNFTWNASTGGIGPITYEFQSSLNPAEVDGVLTTSVWQSPTPLLSPMIHSSGAPDGKWYWQVRAKDGANNYSAWSPIWNVTIDRIAPTVPSILGFKNPTLACGAITNIHSTTVDWSTSTDTTSGIAGYEYYVDYPLANGSGRAIYNPSNLLTSPENYGTLNEGIHYIKVRAKDNAGNFSGWSNICSITADWTAPVISWVTPTDGSTYSGVIPLKAECNEDCDYVNFWWRAEGEIFSSASKRYHYVYDDGTIFEWGLNTMDALKADGTTYVMGDGPYYLYAAGKDLAGNWAKTGEIKVFVNNTPDNMDQCKKGGWDTFTAPDFRNQGDCVSWVQAKGKAWGLNNH